MRHFDGATLRNQREQQARTWLAYHIALFGNARRLPPLAELLEPGERRVQTPDDHRRIARMMNSMFGGSVVSRADKAGA